MTVTWDGDDEYAERKAPAPFGYLLAVDLYECESEHLDDVGFIYEFLETLVRRMGMIKQAPPFVFLSPPGFPDKAGVSGWVPLIESGIQIHTVAPARFVSLDVYCCRRVEHDVVLHIAAQFFRPAHHGWAELERGTRWKS